MTTRQSSEHMGCIATVMEGGAFFEMICLPKIDADEDLGVIYGFMAIWEDVVRMCEAFGLVEGAHHMLAP